MITRSPYRVLHLSAARYDLEDRSHATYSIWKNLQEGFQEYHVMARAKARPGTRRDGSLVIHLCRSARARELEFLLSQFAFVPKALRLKPDVVITQSPVLGGLAALLIARLRNVPVLVELHGEDFIQSRATSLKARVIQLLAASVYPRVDKIRVLTETMRLDLLNTHPNLPPERVCVLAPRVDVSLFSVKTNWQTKMQATTIVMVGSLTNRKGQLRAIRVLSQSRLPLRLFLVGDGPDMKACRAAAARTPDNIEVILPGRLPPDRVAQHLQEADIFLMNSLSEGTPRAIMEAMATGLPVITTNAGYCRDLVQHEVTGVVLSDEQTEYDLLTWTEHLAENPALREQFGRAARVHAEINFESTENFRQYRELIASLPTAQWSPPPWDDMEAMP